MVSLFLTAVTGVVIAHALGPSGKGTVSLLVLVASQVSSSMSFGVEYGLMRYGGNPGTSLKGLAGASLALAVPLGGAAIVLAVALLHFPLSRSVPPGVRPVAYVGMLAIPLLLGAGYVNALLRAAGRLLEAHVFPAALAIAGLVAACVGAIYGFGVVGFAGSAMAALTIGAIAPYVLALRVGILPPRWLRDVTVRRSILRYGLKGHIGTFLQGLNYRLDVFIVASLLSPRDVGLYSVSVAAAEALWIVPNVVGFVILHRSASESASESARVTGLATRLTSAALLIGALVALLVGHQVITVVFGSDFRAAYRPLAVLLPGIWSLGIWKNLTNDLVGRGYPGTRSETAAAAVLVTVVLDLLLIPSMGISGAALASSCAYLVAMLMVVRKYGLVTGSGWREVLIPRVADLALLGQGLRRNSRIAKRRTAATDRSPGHTETHPDRNDPRV